MRRVLLKLARKIGMDAVEKSINKDDLLAAQEVFLTNTIWGIRWVKQFETATYQNEISPVLVAKINEKVAQEMTARR